MRSSDPHELLGSVVRLFWSTGGQGASTTSIPGLFGVRLLCIYPNHVHGGAGPVGGGSRGGRTVRPVDPILHRTEKGADGTVLEPLREALWDPHVAC